MSDELSPRVQRLIESGLLTHDEAVSLNLLTDNEIRQTWRLAAQRLLMQAVGDLREACVSDTDFNTLRGALRGFNRGGIARSGDNVLCATRMLHFVDMTAEEVANNPRANARFDSFLIALIELRRNPSSPDYLAVDRDDELPLDQTKSYHRMGYKLLFCYVPEHRKNFTLSGKDLG